MSGHSKWANIKNRKGAADKKRSEVFTRASKNILTAIREFGGNTNPEMNYKLKQAIEKAREVNMPKENIDRLINRFEERKANLVSIIFEGYGASGVPVIIEVESDNKNRIVAEIRGILKKYGGSLGETNSVMFQFEKKGRIEVGREMTDDELLELMDHGLEDNRGKEILTSVSGLQEVVAQMKNRGIEVVDYGLNYVCLNPTVIKSEVELDKLAEMIEELEGNEDVVNVYGGYDYEE